MGYLLGLMVNRGAKVDTVGGGCAITHEKNAPQPARPSHNLTKVAAPGQPPSATPALPGAVHAPTAPQASSTVSL